MPKLPVISSRDFIKFLCHKDFEYSHTKGSHHVYKHKYDKTRMVTVPERNEIKTGLLNGMLAEAGLT